MRDRSIARQPFPIPVKLRLVLAVGALVACNFIFPPPSTSTPDFGATPAATPSLWPTPLPAPSAQATLAVDIDDLSSFRQAMRPEDAADVLAFADATRYYVDATFTPGLPAQLAGRQRVLYTNTEQQPLADIMFNLYVNTAQFLGRITLGQVWVGGRVVEPELLHDDTVLHIPLAAPLAPGQSVDMSLEWVETVDGDMEYSFARYGESRGVYSMASFVPLVAHREEGRWEAGVQPFTGDPVTSDTALFALRITAPERLAIAVTGSEIGESRAGDGTRTVSVVTGPVRDVSLIVGPLELSQSTVDGTTINVWLLDEHSAKSSDMLREAEDSLGTFNAILGEYPYKEMDYVDVPGFGGIEFPGLVIIGTVEDDGFREVVIAHETAHGWFYGLIGDDQLEQPWLDEGMASYLEVVYYTEVYGPEAGQQVLDGHTNTWTQSPHPELPVGLDVNSYESEGAYFTIVYSKTATFLDRLRQTMGDPAFRDFLRALYDRYQYGFLTTAGFQALAEEECACELGEMFSLWVTDGGPIDLSQP